jgi:hypothetical protein
MSGQTNATDAFADAMTKSSDTIWRIGKNFIFKDFNVDTLKLVVSKRGLVVIIRFFFFFFAPKPTKKKKNK